MSRGISVYLRRQVRLRAKFCCEYCLVPERFLATIFHVDHIRSLKHGGKTVLDNLAYACPHCNQNKGTDVATFEDDAGQSLVRLFHPRKDSWKAHFKIEKGEILPKNSGWIGYDQNIGFQSGRPSDI